MHRLCLTLLFAIAAAPCPALPRGMPTEGTPASGLGHLIATSTWMFPAANIAHLVGMLLIVGPVLVFDCRLLGITRSGSIADLSKALLRWPILGGCIAVPAGLAMFSAEAGALITNPAFRWKLLLLCVAAGNTMIYGIFVADVARACPAGAVPSVQARIHALVSIATWLAIVCCGRLIAFMS